MTKLKRLTREHVCARLLTNSQISHPHSNGLEKSVKPDPLRKPMVNVPGRTHRRGTDRVVDDSRGVHACELPSQDRVFQPSVDGDEARVEHGKHPDHDDDVSGGPDFAYAGGTWRETT